MSTGNFVRLAYVTPLSCLSWKWAGQRPETLALTKEKNRDAEACGFASDTCAEEPRGAGQVCALLSASVGAADVTLPSAHLRFSQPPPSVLVLVDLVAALSETPISCTAVFEIAPSFPAESCRSACVHRLPSACEN